MHKDSVVVVTRQGSSYGRDVLLSSLEAAVPVSAVLLQAWTIKQRLRQLRIYKRRNGWRTAMAHVVLGKLDDCLLSRQRRAVLSDVETIARGAGLPVYLLPTLNGTETLRVLQHLRPDVILLAGVALVSKDVIGSARRIVMNAHPGIVPKYRGNYVVRWALLQGDEIGITVHQVDEGVDTGPIFSVQKIETPIGRSLRDIEARVDRIRAAHLIRETQKYSNGQAEPLPSKRPSVGPAYSLMPPRELIQLYRRLWTRGKDQADDR